MPKKDYKVFSQAYSDTEYPSIPILFKPITAACLGLLGVPVLFSLLFLLNHYPLKPRVCELGREESN